MDFSDVGDSVPAKEDAGKEPNTASAASSGPAVELLATLVSLCSFFQYHPLTVVAMNIEKFFD